ncbi:hypothetical protein QBC33DRAFT_578854 [Phialemonium atrogriseum]|uniref:Aminoglycoside phosphotransferase domain-containing protein n=1 Tax=Phialemonium atrogriseum TaxID=1093897 RepID=A0AAJ0BZV9_9PEZI|nr:uncharacterized protein QBC33DRAFT_578854 [Phialemonium atrogriseum]KAK1766503.1 hypothetical protein QBC33DRAFT_578854 [Phialemonium atrogriseum]
MYDGQEELDNLVWDKNDEDWDESLKQMRLKTTCRQVEHLAELKYGKTATLISPLIIGGFNTIYRIHLEGVSPGVLVRLPGPSLAPIPRHFFYGRDPTLGSFIILQHVENRGSMSARLTTPNDDPSVTHVLNPDVAETTLQNLWTKAARCLLQLSQLSYPRIGALVEVDSGSYEIAGRPITHNMTDMVRLANIPCAVLPQEGETYGTADEWYVALAEMHLAQLVFQHNDLAGQAGQLSTFGFAEDDWSAQSSKIVPSTLSPAPAGSDSIRLWGDDFRAGNILLDESDDIAAVIDWEFAYAGPAQFILDPPWWLLLDLAETWSSGIDNWTETYDVRLKTWLSAMKRAEGSMGEPGPLPVALSTYMRESRETGRFWLNYSARKSWAFDAMYWKYLDEGFFGDRGDDISDHDLWKTRIHLLSEEEREAMEPFVERKMNESKERRIVDWDLTEAKQRFSEVLFD